MQSCGPPGIEFETNALEDIANSVKAILGNIIYCFHAVMTNLNLQQSLLQSSVSYDPSEIIVIC